MSLASEYESSRLAGWMDRYLAGPMFVLALATLAVLSGVIHRLADGYAASFVEARFIAWSLAFLWPFFIVEALLRFFVTRHQIAIWPRVGILVATILFPWVWLGLRAYSDPGKLWLPGLGWRKADRSLRRWLERYFSVPMVLCALLTLPVLTLEYLWEEQVHQHFWLRFSLDLGNSLIWMAFVLEFTIMISLAENRILYCWQNWMDLAVVVLPVLDFLPILRLSQLARVVQINQVSRLSRLYRLRGMIWKAWRAILLLEILTRLLGNYRERRLRKLRDLIAAKQIELEDLRQELAELEQETEKKVPG